MTRDADRLPPHSVEAEQGVLGCILLSPSECMGGCIEVLKAGSLAFYLVAHQMIYGTLLAMHDGGRAIDLITLQQRLRDDQQLEGVGGVAYLACLPDAVPSAANLGYYLDIVRQKFVLRRMIGTCTDIIQRAYDHQGEVDALIGQVEGALSELTEQETQAREVHIKEIIKKNLTTLEAHYTRGAQQLNGLPTGAPGNYLDKIIGGIQANYYMLLAGRPGSGKTSLALNIVEYLARDYEWWEPTGEWHPLEEGEEKARPVMRKNRGIPICVFSIEMTAESLGMQLIFGRAGVDMARYMQGYKSEGDDQKLCVAAGHLAGCNIYVDDCAGQTDAQIAAKARRMARQHGIKLFVLDYLQLLRTENRRDDERQRVSAMSDRVCDLKKQLNIPWLVLAQMNRAIETSAVERVPVLSDLKGCDDPAANCDVAMFTYKCPRKKKKENDPKTDDEIIDDAAEANGWAWSEVPYRVDIVIPKNRYGPTGMAQMVFRKNLRKFEDWHQWKMRHGVEGAKQGERKQKEFTGEGVAENWPKGGEE